MYIYRNNELYHYGIKGQKWGVRRYQNEDRSLTPAGKKRYAKDSAKLEKYQGTVDKRLIKTAKKAQKLQKKSKMGWGFTTRRDIFKAADRYRRSNKKYQRALKRANRFYNRMEKTYTVNLSKDQVEKGRNYLHLAELRDFMSADLSVLNEMKHSDDEKDALCHMGKKGMKWGVLNGPPYPIDKNKSSTSQYDYSKMNLSSDSLPIVRVSKKEYAHVMSEVATHASDEQRKQKTFRKTIYDDDEHASIVYDIENGFDGTYRIFGRTVLNPLSVDSYEWRDDDD